MRLSLKLAVLCALAAFIPLFIASLIVISEASSRTRSQALEHLRSDARAVGSLYEKRLVELRAAAQELADEIANRALVSADNLDRNNSAALARLQDQLPRAQSEASLDFVIVADPLGRVIARHNDRPLAGETLLDPGDKNVLAERVISSGNTPAAACVIERGERYTRLGLNRIAQVRLLDGTTMDQALMMEACAPIFSGGRFVGTVLIGQMLNTYYKPRASSSPLQTPLVAEARQILLHPGEEQTGALISLEKTIVASSLPLNGARDASSGPALVGAIRDTSRSEESLQQDENRYAVAWQPLKSLDGTTVGAIGVARAEREMGGVAGTTAILIGGVASLLAAGSGFMFGRSIGARLADLKEAAGRWSLGDLSTPARDREPFLAKWIPAELVKDEINQLAKQLDEMRESFRQALERMRKR
jgi:HAMP domain-containing protein